MTESKVSAVYAMPDLQAGDWATWFGAAGALLAFLAALATLLLQLRTGEESRLQARRAQASKILISMHRLRETANGSVFDFVVENQSGLPCYFTYFEVLDCDTDRYFQLGTLSTKYRTEVELGPEYRASGGWPYFRITFMDSANIFWERDSLGRLRETSDRGRRKSRVIWRVGKVTETFAERRARELDSSLGRLPAGIPDGVAGYLSARGDIRMPYNDPVRPLPSSPTATPRPGPDA